MIQMELTRSGSEAGRHVGGRGLLLLHDVLVAHAAQALVSSVAVEATPVPRERKNCIAIKNPKLFLICIKIF